MLIEAIRPVFETIAIMLGLVIRYQLLWEIILGAEVLALIGFIVYNKIKGGE